MKNQIILLLTSTFLLIASCASTCMEYRSATTAARSEQNLKRAEEWGLKALESPACNPTSNALVPYFLATEVYLNRKNYNKMAEMFTIAKQRNPNQPLENPFKLGDTPIETISEGVEAYREQEWVMIYNQAVDLYQKGKINTAHEQIEIAILINPRKVENYSTFAFWHIEDNNMEIALNIIDRGLEVDNRNSILYQMKADISAQNDELKSALELYLKAVEYSDDPGSIMRKLLFIYIDLGENQKAIEYSNELMNRYPDDPDLYYNVGVLYQRLATEIYDSSLDKFNNIDKDLNSETILNLYKSYKQAREYAYNSRDYFLQASDLEMDENSLTMEAAKEMKRVMKNIDDIFIPSIRKTAREIDLILE